MESGKRHTQDATALLSKSDADIHPLRPLQHGTGTVDCRTDAPDASASRLQRGHVMLDSAVIRQLRQGRLMSQQDLANECWRRNIPLSLTTIKRAEAGRAVRFRIAREFARCFDVPVTRILHAKNPVAATGSDTH